MKTKRVFSDFDAFAASVRDVDCRMLLQNPGNRYWATEQVRLGAVDLQIGSLGSGNIVEGQSWSQGFLFYFPMTPAPYRANGVGFSKGSLIVMEPGCEFCVSTKCEHDWFSVFVSSESLKDRHRATGQDNAVLPRCYVARPTSSVVTRLSPLVRDVMTAASASKCFIGSLGAKTAERQLVDLCKHLVAGLAPDNKKQGRKPISRAKVIGRAKECVGHDRTVDIPQLASASMVSERSLRNIFKDFYQTSPARYFRLAQQFQVHAALRRADPELSSVSDILLEKGVFEFGRFAARYKHLFGESPSQTLGRTLYRN